jgi:DNA-binding LacI/PurR family transcriptional regulator
VKRNSKISRLKPRVTLSDLARDLNVSIATVSRAFHDGVTIADETRYAVAQRLLARKPRPDGIFGTNDIMALGVIDTARRNSG